MAQAAIDTSKLPRIEGSRIAVLLSKWYPEHVQSMRDKCIELLNKQGASRIDQHVLPGTLEFPFAAQQLVRRYDDLDAIVCLSVVLEGDTKHFDLIMQACAQGLTSVGRDSGVPVINEILPVTDISQAIARCGDDEFNKGIEAGAAAIEMISWCRKLKRDSQSDTLGFG